jgi:hypothetical protein
MGGLEGFAPPTLQGGGLGVVIGAGTTKSCCHSHNPTPALPSYEGREPEKILTVNYVPI